MPYPGQTPYGVPSSFTPYSSMPSTGPTSKPSGNGSWIWDAAKGIFKWVANNSGDILSTTGNLIEGYMSSEDRQKQLDELRRQFDENLKQRQAEQAFANEQTERTTGNTEAQNAVRAQTMLNAAPIADKAQALALARLGVSPGAFQPRDFTRGAGDLTRGFTAPSANVASTMQSAAQNYTPGSGGYDTSAIRMLLARMQANQRSRPASTTVPPPDPTEPPNPTRPPIDRKKFVMTKPTFPTPEQPDDREPDDDTDDTGFRDPRSVVARRMGVAYV